MGNEGEARVFGPEGAKFAVELSGLFKCFVANEVAALDADTADSGAFEKDDGVVAGEFMFLSGAEGLEEMMWFARPVGGTVHGAAVAEKDAAGIHGGVKVLEVALDVVDGALGGEDPAGFSRAWEAAGEEHGGGLGNDDDGGADLAAEEVGGSGFASAGAPGEDDAAAAIFCGGHLRISWREVVGSCGCVVKTDMGK